ncbi:MAG TPA: hypothetical protein VGB28_00155 [Actinomycetota bacterium]|jgi:multidrug efflux pump subunit AcrA (membrane-fusion protein)
MTERVVTAPGWGRVGTLTPPGRVVEQGTVIGVLREQGALVPLVASTAGVLMGWLVLEGERVPPGRPLARIRILDRD